MELLLLRHIATVCVQEYCHQALFQQPRRRVVVSAVYTHVVVYVWYPSYTLTHTLNIELWNLQHTSFYAGIVAGPPDRINAFVGSTVDVCSVAFNFCTCSVVQVDGSHDFRNCLSSYKGELLLANYTFIDIADDHTVKFFFRCDGYGDEPSNKTTISVQGTYGTSSILTTVGTNRILLRTKRVWNRRLLQELLCRRVVVFPYGGLVHKHTSELVGSQRVGHTLPNYCFLLISSNCFLLISSS